jgi:hypothetical protein
MIALLVSLLAIGPQTAPDQRTPAPEGTVISAVEVSGFDIDRFSPGLRQDLRALVGTPLKQDRLDALAARIEEERPRRVAAVRPVLDADGKARVIFLVGQRGETREGGNVNDKYVVERVETEDFPDDAIPQALRDDLQALVGRPLDSDAADKLQARLEQKVSRYQVTRRIERGSEPGTIRLVFEAHRREQPLWLRYQPLRTNAVFHSDQGWGTYLDLGIGNREIRVTPILVLDDADDLVEEYGGAGVRVETRKLGTRRLGASLEWSWFEDGWKDETRAAVAANPSLPRLYDTRQTVTPLIKFALTPELTLSAGVGITELEPLAPLAGSSAANAAIVGLDVRKRWEAGDRATQQVDASVQLRAGTRVLESDTVYDRYLAQGAYAYDQGRHHATVTGMAGHISGNAPLFERFTLGDTRTLRGWDKYTINPAGGSKLYYASLEYAYTGLSVFLDVGSVWDGPGESHARVSTGLGFYAGPAFATIGFPLNTNKVTAVFTMGLRVSETKLRWW